MVYVAERGASIRQIIMERGIFPLYKRDLQKGKVPEFWTGGIRDIHIIAQGIFLCSHPLNYRRSRMHHARC